MSAVKPRARSPVTTKPALKDAPAPPSAVGRGSRALRVTAASCSPLDDVEPRALGFSYWFDAAKTGQPYPVTLRFTGRRIDVQGKPHERDRFEVLKTLDPVIPGSGRVVLTMRVPGLNPGAWQVTASPVASPLPRAGVKPAALTSSRRTFLPKGVATGTTGFAPLVGVLAPGARLGSWPALVTVGTVIALIVQAVLAGRAGIPAGPLLLTSVVACLAGLVGAKAYYLRTHPGRKMTVTGGMSIQGFVLVAIPAAALGAWLSGLSVGEVLDVTAPGLLLGMAVGRWGCFFGGCCAGRPTGSRWGLWSSDRQLGVRRIPVQLLESLMAAAMGVAALLSVLFAVPRVSGVIFVAAVAAYTFGRQVLFPLRDIPRTTAHGRTATMVVSGVIAVLAIATAVIW